MFNHRRISMIVFVSLVAAMSACKEEKPSISVTELWESQYQENIEAIEKISALINDPSFASETVEFQKAENTLSNLVSAKLLQARLNETATLPEATDMTELNTLFVSIRDEIALSRAIKTSADFNTEPNIAPSHKLDFLGGDRIHFLGDSRAYQEIAKMVSRHATGEWSFRETDPKLIKTKEAEERKAAISEQIARLNNLKYIVVAKDIAYIPALLNFEESTYETALLLTDAKIYDADTKVMLGNGVLSFESSEELYMPSLPGSDRNREIMAKIRLARDMVSAKIRTTGDKFSELEL